MTESNDRRRKEDKELMKAAFKEAMGEFMDKRYSEFGRWGAQIIASAVIGGIAWFVLTSTGWNRPGMK